MILILGVTGDDILYFRSKMTSLESGTLMSGIEYFTGKISREEVTVAVTGQTDYLSSLVAGMLIEHFQPYLVFNVGSITSFSPQLKQGDIFIAERYYFSGVDLTSLPEHPDYGAIPPYGEFFIADTALNSRLEASAYSLTNRYIQRGYLLSGEVRYRDEKELNPLLRDHFLKNDEDEMVAYDCTSGGVALACQFTSTALLTIKAVSYQLSHPEQDLNYVRKGLELQPTIGKIITKFLLEKENA